MPLSDSKAVFSQMEFLFVPIINASDFTVEFPIGMLQRAVAVLRIREVDMLNNTAARFRVKRSQFGFRLRIQPQQIFICLPQYGKAG